MPLYVFEVKTEVVVYGKDLMDACQNCEDDLSDIKSWSEFETDFIDKIVNSSQLAQYGWDDVCLPYGHDGNTRIKDLL